MANRPDPRDSLARNLRFLMTQADLSEQNLADRSGVGQKTINNILNKVNSPTLSTVEKLAAAFGLTGWHLIMPNLPDELISSPTLAKLFSDYVSATPEGRKLIAHIADRETSRSAVASN